MSLLAHDVLLEYIPAKTRPIEEIFQKEDHPSIRKIKEFKNNGKNPVKEAGHDIWHKRYVKYPTIFLAMFVVVFIILNLPLFFARYYPSGPKLTYKYVKETVPSTMAKSAPLEPGETIPNGNFLVVPTISVDAPIIWVNTYDETTIDQYLPKE